MPSSQSRQHAMHHAATEQLGFDAAWCAQEVSKVDLIKPVATAAVANLLMAAPSFAEAG